jgi:hypothetical protein
MLPTYYRFTERDGRKGPPAGNKAKCNCTNTPQARPLHIIDSIGTIPWKRKLPLNRAQVSNHAAIVRRSGPTFLGTSGPAGSSSTPDQSMICWDFVQSRLPVSGGGKLHPTNAPHGTLPTTTPAAPWPRVGRLMPYSNPDHAYTARPRCGGHSIGQLGETTEVVKRRCARVHLWKARTDAGAILPRKNSAMRSWSRIMFFACRS